MILNIMKIKYLVSSHPAYSVPRDKLLATLRPQVPAADITVVVSCCPKARTYTHDGITYDDVLENAYELTSLIHVVNHPDAYEGYTHVFLFHDTMECGPNAYRLIESHPEYDWDVSYAVAFGNGNYRTMVGLYRISFLHSISEHVNSWSGISKARAIAIEMNAADPLHPASLTKKIQTFPNASPWVRGTAKKKYSTDMRWSAYIPSIDTTKWYKKPPVYDEIFHNRP